MITHCPYYIVDLCIVRSAAQALHNPARNNMWLIDWVFGRFRGRIK